MNTIPAGLICSVCCEVALLGVCRILAPLTNFANDCSSDPLAPGKPVAIPVATAGSTTLTNPTNFEQGDSTLDIRTVTPDYISQPFQISAKEYQQGFRLEQLARINAETLAAAVWAKVLPLIKNNASTGFPVANVVVKALVDFTPATLGEVYAKLICSPKHLILSPDAIAKLFYVPGGCCMPLTGGTGPAAFGYASITEQSVWGGSDLNTYGFAFCRDAIAIVSGVPAMPPQCGSIIASQSVTQPGTGLTVQFNLWCSAQSRSLWGSYDIMFGAAIGVPCKGVLLKAA